MSSQVDTHTHTENYKLNKDKTLTKKIDACHRPAIQLKVKSGNAVIEFSTLSYERAFQLLYTYYEEQSLKYYTSKTEKVDEGGNVVCDIISVNICTKAGKKGKFCFTINFYRTTCTALVNGAQLNKFITNDFPKLEELCKTMYNQDDEISVSDTLIKAKNVLYTNTHS